MTLDRPNETPGMESLKRRKGLLPLAVLNVLYTSPTFLSALMVLLRPEENWNHVSIIAAPYTLVLIVAFYLSLIWTWFGSDASYRVFAILIAVLTLLYIIESAIFIQTWWVLGTTLGGLSARGWWESTGSIRAIFWFILNYWYFFRREVHGNDK